MFRTRFFAVTVRIYAALAALWLLYVVYLDLTQDMFPRVLIGGIKILAVATLVVGAVACVVSAFVSRSRRHAGAPAFHGSPAE